MLRMHKILDQITPSMRRSPSYSNELVVIANAEVPIGLLATLILITSHFMSFVILFTKHSFTKSEQNIYKNIYSVLFLSWYTHGCITGNSIALIHSLKCYNLSIFSKSAKKTRNHFVLFKLTFSPNNDLLAFTS